MANAPSTSTKSQGERTVDEIIFGVQNVHFYLLINRRIKVTKD